MKRLSLIASALAVLGLTACEKTLDVMDDEMSSGFGQVKNSLLQVRTRTGGVTSDEAVVAYPVTVYVFQGDEYKAEQTIGDEGQTLNIALTEGTYSGMPWVEHRLTIMCSLMFQKLRCRHPLRCVKDMSMAT